MFVRYWLMQLVQNLQRRNAVSVRVLVGQSWGQGVFASTLTFESSCFLSTLAFLDLCHLEKEWLTSPCY